MELKELLGEELYKQVQAKIDEKNSAEPDKLKHVRYTDLSEGKYVSKEKYDSELEKLNGLITGKDTEIGNANKLIEELKKASKGDEREVEDNTVIFTAFNRKLLRDLEELRNLLVRNKPERVMKNLDELIEDTKKDITE